MISRLDVTIAAFHYKEVHDSAVQKQQLLFQRLTAVMLPEQSPPLSSDPDDARLDFGPGSD